MKNIITAYLFLITLSGYAQKLYPANQSELIFSGAQMNSTNDVSSYPVTRFSGFFNYEAQRHLNFNKSSGMYFGMGIKNIGIINHFNGTDFRFKQRAYTLSFPLALKLGRVDRMAFLALGAEANIMYQYKEKFLYGNTKTRKSEWFSDKVNLFNPAVFLQFKFFKTQVITFKYYLDDFLKYQSGGLTLPDGTIVSDYGKSSKLFYVSWGSNIEIREPGNKNIKKVEKRIRSARLE
jgi:hypothetical protein